jgi:hypothetical protein
MLSRNKGTKFILNYEKKISSKKDFFFVISGQAKSDNCIGNYLINNILLFFFNHNSALGTTYPLLYFNNILTLSYSYFAVFHLQWGLFF